MLKTITIVATAAFPWRTGTAILALLRAFYLARKGYDVRLYVPWIKQSEQRLLFGETLIFATPQEQEVAIREYLPGDSRELQIEFYPASYHHWLGSILPNAPLSQRLRHSDWLILEEPEHLNWKHPFNDYHRCAERVTGIVLTNYGYYCRNALKGVPKLCGLLTAYNNWLISRHCDDVIMLGNGLPLVANSQAMNVSGIHPAFFESASYDGSTQGVYFMGKLIWDKGFDEMIDLLSDSPIQSIDIYGMGKDQSEISDYAEKRGVVLNYKGNSSNPAEDLKRYKIFINSSRSEMTCTTTAEALGQGKFVIIPFCSSNEAFYGFKNCLVYSSAEEFQRHLAYALTHTPVEDEQLQTLSWESAINKLLNYYENPLLGGQ